MTLEQETSSAAFEDARVATRSALEAELEARRKWLVRDKRFQRLCYYLFLIVSLLAAFSASVIAGLDKGDSSRVALIVLPLVGAFCASLIQQFGWREVYQLREKGRIDIDELRYAVHRARPRTLADLQRLEEMVHNRLVAISREQSGTFFAHMRGDKHSSSSRSGGDSPSMRQ